MGTIYNLITSMTNLGIGGRVSSVGHLKTKQKHYRVRMTRTRLCGVTSFKYRWPSGFPSVPWLWHGHSLEYPGIGAGKGENANERMA